MMIRFKVIAYDGILSGLNYIVPENEVDIFMEKFNSHGHWQVMGTQYNHLAMWSDDNETLRRL